MHHRHLSQSTYLYYPRGYTDIWVDSIDTLIKTSAWQSITGSWKNVSLNLKHDKQKKGVKTNSKFFFQTKCHFSNNFRFVLQYPLSLTSFLGESFFQVFNCIYWAFLQLRVFFFSQIRNSIKSAGWCRLQQLFFSFNINTCIFAKKKKWLV